ncbi:hypothetical protein [Krasilnikovia sp. MM14-A1259]|uniref:hypothetical protein n=1 Tax=Krasilnikovia sp. MM14-A1259 TaxID=3373539 RepID=UPI003818D05F
MAGHARAAVLFDIDGTLVDTTYLHTVAWWRTCCGPWPGSASQWCSPHRPRNAGAVATYRDPADLHAALGDSAIARLGHR